jgi:hypothetical protein
MADERDIPHFNKMAAEAKKRAANYMALKGALEPKDAKNKAEQMVRKFSILLNYDFVTDLRWHDPNCEDRNNRVKKDAKKCALAALDLIIEQNNVWIMQTNKGTNNYWNEVKKEINKI